MEMIEPRRDTPAEAPQVDRVRDAMRDHDERRERVEKATEDKPERDDTPEPGVPRKREDAEGSEEAE
jgi:hypothetical protein